MCDVCVVGDMCDVCVACDVGDVGGGGKVDVLPHRLYRHTHTIGVRACSSSTRSSPPFNAARACPRPSYPLPTYRLQSTISYLPGIYLVCMGQLA